MSFNTPADYHMHTHNSGDSKAPMGDMVRNAIGKGLKEICFTEHMDLDYPDFPDLPPEKFNLNIPAYREELLKYKERYKDKITVKFGIEVGMQPQVNDENLRIVKENGFDFVIASVHLVDKRDPFYGDFWTHCSVEDTFKRYFEITLENIKHFTDFDVLGHLDYIARYVPDGDTTYSYERFKDQIDEILLYLAQNGKGLDFNSKVLSRDNTLFPNPCPAALKRFKELGGEIITFGSDAHRPEAIAYEFEKMRQIALECGFTHYYTFEHRVPTAHNL
jgi:histidinol-phosphatase (PHP family)